MEDWLVRAAEGELFKVIPISHRETRQKGDPEVFTDHRLDDVDVRRAVENVRPEVSPTTHLLEGLVMEKFSIGDDELFVAQTSKINRGLFGQGVVGADNDLEGEAGQLLGL